MPSALTIGVGWSTEFNRSFRERLQYRRLRYAYRGPSFFASAMVNAGHRVKFMRFDEGLRAPDLDGTTDRISDGVDLLYVSTHGECRKSEYQAILYDANWRPCANGFGDSGPSVAVFETCDLIKLADADWHKPWVASAGPSLRLLLGFASLATIEQVSTKRGRLFAERILSGAPIGAAWLEAVHSTGFTGLDIGVAIGFGDSASDADWALHRLRLDDLPATRHESHAIAAMEVNR